MFFSSDGHDEFVQENHKMSWPRAKIWQAKKLVKLFDTFSTTEREKKYASLEKN